VLIFSEQEINMSIKSYVGCAVAATAVVVGAAIAGIAASRVTAAEPGAAVKYEEQIGGGAPTKVVQDNDVLRATLITFPKGQVRQGGVKRKSDQVLIYIDKAKFTHLPTPGTQFTAETQSTEEPGQVTYHAKDSVVGTIRVDEPYRVMYVEIKRAAPVTK
jgi:hypothetical protein